MDTVPTHVVDPANDPVLYMSNERFTVPEVLFHPNDIGEYQASTGSPR
jgi:hypothetical protein